jgi:IS4 transposase
MNKDTKKSTFKQVFSALSQLNQRFEEMNADRCVKKMTTLQFIELMTTAQMNKEPALRDISNSLSKEELSMEINLPSISASQLSRRLRDLRTEILQMLFKSLVTHFGCKNGFANIQKNLGNIYMIDSTTITLCLTKYRWAEFRKTKSGVKAHLRLKFGVDGNIPDKVVVTPAKPSDRSKMDELVVDEAGALNLFDRGYNDYAKFDEYCEKDVLFITRLKSNAIVEVITDIPVDPEGAIDSDQIVRIGTGNKQMKHHLRLLKTTDTEGNLVMILTDDFARSAREIGDLYRYRWQIELFFKWIKQHLTVKHLYGESPQAVENQIYMALITYCLLMLLKMETGFTGTLLDIHRLVKTCLLEPFDAFLQQLFRAKRASKGRRKTADYQIIFEETMRQVVTGEADYLDDPTFGPVIL